MVQTGITRRIDDLGRIVIPKEIRNSLKIKNSDEINIGVDGNNIILNKHEVDEHDKTIQLFLNCVGKYLQTNILLTSRDKVIYTYFYDKNDYLHLINNDSLFKVVEKRKKITDINDSLNIFKEIDANFIINPLIINGDLFGSIIMFGDKNLVNYSKIIDIMSVFLENYLE